jgi:Ser/Thr protein kinase RdoA (MazF antagonist)
MTEAAEAAAAWGGRDPRLIVARENQVYRIDLPSGRAALRLHRPGYQDEVAIRSELWWCAALARAGVPVARPLPALGGDLLLRLASGRMASAVAWIEGVPLSAEASDAALRERRYLALGRLLAQLHRETDRLALPGWFSRPAWDSAGLVGDAPFWGRFWTHPAATADQRATLLQARDLLRRELPARERAADFGPIHADVLRENVLVNEDSLSLIDFDDSGLGFRLYDLGTALLPCLTDPAYPALRAALIAGYGETRPCDPWLVDLLTLARALASVGWTMPRLAADDPVHLSHLARATGFSRQILAAAGGQTTTSMASCSVTPNTRL